MSAARYTCPSCCGVCRVPDSLIGKEMTCPSCKKRVVVRAMGGRTILELADVDGRARTTLHRPKKKPPTVEEVLPVLEEAYESEDPSAKSWIIWLVLPAAALVFSLMFCLVASVVRFWPRGEDSAANTTTPVVAQAPKAMEEKQPADAEKKQEAPEVVLPPAQPVQPVAQAQPPQLREQAPIPDLIFFTVGRESPSPAASDGDTIKIAMPWFGVFAPTTAC